MTNFLDGPAKGQHLMLKRAPRFLRVTEEAGKFDALDQLEDQAKLSEKLFAYELVGTPGFAFITCRGGTGGPCVVATYQFLRDQPEDIILRTNSAWKDWCYANADKPKATGME